MGHHPDPLDNAGYEHVIRFLLEHGCEKGSMQGDDLIFYYPDNRSFGVCVNVNPKLKRSGYPKGTLLGNIRNLQSLSRSRITKKTWRDWFRKERNF